MTLIKGIAAARVLMTFAAVFLFVVMPFAMVMAAAVAEGQRSVQEKFDYFSDFHLGCAAVDSDA